MACLGALEHFRSLLCPDNAGEAISLKARVQRGHGRVGSHGAVDGVDHLAVKLREQRGLVEHNVANVADGGAVVVVVALRVEQNGPHAIKERSAGPVHVRPLAVVIDLQELHVVLAQKVSHARKVKVGRHKDQGAFFLLALQLRQNVPNKVLEARIRNPSKSRGVHSQKYLGARTYRCVLGKGGG